ncbi:MAG: ABC transporter permease subunit [Anaerolineae bacterium]|nr:ABC transporter permease subunit [Anaerolineae bacterium]
MTTLKRILTQIFNPRANLEKIPQSLLDSHDGEALGGARGGLHIRDILTNIPLILGTLIVLSLFFLVLFGPVFAPTNPYIAGQHIVPHFDRETNEFIRPPLLPSDEFILGTDEWGTDILSMLMHGARNTLITCAFITMMRVILGLAFGAIAGWNEGKTSDRFIMALIGLSTSLPLLIITMITILALDIRKGLPVFIIALTLFGWTEIAQYIRSEFLILRKKPFIEGAHASGLTSLQIAVRHVLPNVLPQILVITFLEMGAVLMLLGELGFLGVYIGGGSRVDLTEPMGPQKILTLPEVPEWGAMIADGSKWLRSFPHIVFPPAVAFFYSVVGFNSLGEGLRRLIEIRTVNTAFLLRRQMLAVIAAIALATVFILNNTGAAPWFAKVANAFDENIAYQHTKALTAMDGRGVGQPGGQQAADYIAEKFEQYGLKPGWKKNSYVHTLDTVVVRPISQPELSIISPAPISFQHQVDFGYMIEGHGGSGAAQAPLTFVGFQPDHGNYAWDSFKGLDLRGRIAVVIQDNAPSNFATEALIRGAVGVIWIVGDGRDDVRSQLSFPVSEMDFLLTPQIPIFRIRPNVADAIFDQAETSINQLFLPETTSTTSGDGWFTHDFSVRVSMSASLSPPQELQVPSIMGYIPGSDFDLSEELVIIFTSFDGLGIDPDGTIYPAANHNAAGVGLMLEIARLWQEQEIDVRRTTLFVAWGASTLDQNSARIWLEDPFNFRHLHTQSLSGRTEPAILIQLDYIGSGGLSLLAHPDSDERILNLFEETNQEAFSVDLVSHRDTPEFTRDILTMRIRSWISFKWVGLPLSPVEDSFDRIDKNKIEEFGKLLALVLTKLVRESVY